MMAEFSPPRALATAAHDSGRMLLTVTRSEDMARGIRSITLRDPSGAPLPSFTPGSHVVAECGDRRNAYSLTGSPFEPDDYRLTVLLRPDGNGGSAWMHRLRPGDKVPVSRPRSAFAPVAVARRHLLVAGGVGITPMVSHARAALAWGRPLTLLYRYRAGRGAHLAELRSLCGPDFEEFTGRDEFEIRLHSALRSQPLGSHLYVCGPAGLMDYVRDQARIAGWPAERVHEERFSAADLDPGDPFTVRLARTGRRVAVPAGLSLLAALEGAGVPVPSMCRQGVCGECRVPVRAGRPQHRDLYLSAAERAAGDSVMCCVSRSEDEELELDL